MNFLCFNFLMLVYFGQDISESADGQIALLVELTAREEEKLLQWISSQLEQRREREKIIDIITHIWQMHTSAFD